MRIRKDITDEQLGNFHRKINIITERLGTSLLFDNTMQALQCIYENEFRVGLNAAEDLQYLLQRPLGASKVLTPTSEVVIPDVAEKETALLFNNKRRYDSFAHVDATALADVQPGQRAGRIVVHKAFGMSNPIEIAAELLQVPNETPVTWLEKMLIWRGYAITLPVAETLMDIQIKELDLGLNRCKRMSGLCYYPTNGAFIETWPGKIEVFYFNREIPRKWRSWREPFRPMGSSNYNLTNWIIRG
jgi:hypothetical protein